MLILSGLTRLKCSHIWSFQGWDPRVGLPKARQQWVAKREAAGDATPTQMFYAKQGTITEEMAFVAAREQMPVEFVRSEV